MEKFTWELARMSPRLGCWQSRGNDCSTCFVPRRNPHRQRSVIIRLSWRSCIADKRLSLDLRWSRTKCTRGLAEIEKCPQVITSSRVGKAQSAFDHVEVAFYKAQDTAEIMRAIVDISCGCVCRHKDEWHPKAVLILINDLWSSVVVPATPVIPGNKNGGICPICFTVSTLRVVTDSVHYRCYPIRSSACIHTGMIGILPVRNDPTQIRQLALLNVGEHLRRLEDNIAAPPSAGSQITCGLAKMGNGVGRHPNIAALRACRRPRQISRSIISPSPSSQHQVCKRLMLEARIYRSH